MKTPEHIPTVAVIGGSGLYDLQEHLTKREEITVDTPYGETSDTIVSGLLRQEGVTVSILFLPRHGVGHRILPSEVNYRANIWALKKLGAQWCIAVSAVGSLKEEIEPGNVVIVDQYIDKTYKRECTFLVMELLGTYHLVLQFRQNLHMCFLRRQIIWRFLCNVEEHIWLWRVRHFRLWPNPIYTVSGGWM